MRKKINNIITQLICCVIIFTGIGGCANTAEKRFNEKNFILGTTIKVDQGGIIASELHGEVKTERSWVGIMNSEDGWGPAILTFSNDYIEKKLYYIGFEESFLHLMYREYSRGNEQPSVNNTQKYNPDQDPFIRLGVFNIKAISIEGSQASFVILDKQQWDSEKQNYLSAKAKRKKEEKLDKIIDAINSIRSETQAAKNYIEQFVNITPNLRSITQAAYEFNELNKTFNEAKEKNYSIDQLIEIYQILEAQYTQSAQYFISVATALEAWEAMDLDFRRAAQSGIEKKYFAMALDIKNSGERNLQAEQFAEATQMFLNAQQEVNHITTYYLNY